MSTGGKTGFLMRQRTEPDANASMEAKGKAKKSIQKKKQKTTKLEDKTKRKGNTGNGKRERTNEE